LSDRGPLICVDELAARRGEGTVRVADVRWYLGKPGAGRAAYDEGHIAGAAFIDLDADLSDAEGFGAPGRHPLPSPQAFARRMAELGFGSDDFIVAYDDAGGTIAARLWWMLDNLGHRGGVAVLDGGIQAWRAADHELVQDEPTSAPATMELAAKWHDVIERDVLARKLGEVTLVDARAPERYRGEVEPVDPAAGHIPTAVNLPVANNLGGSASGPFKSADELRAAYA
jgi:thiosulfate/3-mercaptopyruvate sulfurtransferase